MKENKLNTLLEDSATSFPDRAALLYPGGQLTYTELNQEAEHVSRALGLAGVTEGSRVAVCGPKSASIVACLFGILKRGAAYLPVDHSSPSTRNKFIIENAEVHALIINKHISYGLENFEKICEIGEELVLFRNSQPAKQPSPLGLAYILYTSGSTGFPKGVMYTHHAAMHFISWCSETFNVTSGDRFISVAPFHFDLSVFDLFVSVKHGASLYLAGENMVRSPELFAAALAEQKITILYSTPTTLSMLSEYGKLEKYDLVSLRLVLFAGEVFPIKSFRRFCEKIPGACYYNLYGPTETNVCTFYKVEKQPASGIPIGRCCPHYKSIISDDELLISGAGLMSGYWGLPGTQSFFIDKDGVAWYRTGDLVSVDDHGNLLFNGRRDRMVKRNGFRIELDEIEKALSLHPGISKASVVSVKTAEQQPVITGFIVLTDKTENSVIKMKEYCMNNLPSYMIPNNFIFMDEIPYTSGFKVDYQKLISLV
ncbi:MAG TPA: amino acid adenylation domain-containing protein [Bacteroidia bacterium]|jgi:amino acid adenylation domain-containing protein